MTFEEIISPVLAGTKSTNDLFAGAKYARRAWPAGDYIGTVPNPAQPTRPVLVILRDERWGAISRTWDTANEDRGADDWYLIED